MSNQFLITKWVDDGSPVDVVYLDFQKVFDKVLHQRVLLKLKAHGICNGVINWIEKWRDFKQEIRFGWATTGISIKTYTIINYVS